MKKTLTGNLLLMLAAMIWGFAFVAQVVVIDSGIGPVSFNALRFMLGVFTLFPVILIFDRKKENAESRKNLLIGSLISGSFLFAAANIQQYALTINANPGFAGFITALYTVWTPVAYFLVFKKKTAPTVWVAVGVSILGFYLLCMTDGGSISFGLDVILLLISTLFWTAQILAVDHFVQKTSALKLSLGQYLVCSLLSFAYAFIFESDTLTLTAIYEAKWSILYCGILSVGVAYTLQVVAQKRVDPTFAAIVLSTEAVFSAIGGVLFGIDTLTVFGYCGCILMFLGIVLSQLPGKSNRKRSGE